MENTITFNEDIVISSQEKILNGKLFIPEQSLAIVIFVDESGRVMEDELSQNIAHAMQHKGFATLMANFLPPKNSEYKVEAQDINTHAAHVRAIIKWVQDNPQTEHLNVGIFSTKSGTAAALEALSGQDIHINALVSLGGRPDLAEDALKNIEIPLLFICGDKDNANVIQHEKALAYFNTSSKMEVLNDAGEGFHATSDQESVLSMSTEWFIKNL